MTRFWDGRTDGRSDCTPRPAFAFGNAGKNKQFQVTCNRIVVVVGLINENMLKKQQQTYKFDFRKIDNNIEIQSHLVIY